ncbi:MAG: LamG-like jellyroll fold domain-containing protein [Planctomycetota bacterium]
MSLLIIDPSRFGAAVPKTIPGLVGWWDAQDEGTITTDVGGDVVTWADKSGNGYDLSQADTTKQPTPVLVSGRQMLEFDGVNDLLRRVDTDDLDFAGDFEIHVVYRTADTNRGALVTKGNAIRYHIRVNDADGNNGDLVCEIDDDTTSRRVVDTSVNYNDDSVRMVAMVRDGNNLRQFANGVETGASPVDVTGYGSIANTDEFNVGAFSDVLQHLDGEIGEIVVYDRAMSVSERGLLVGYLVERWGVG